MTTNDKKIKKVRSYLIDNARLLKKYRLRTLNVIHFPKRRKVPILSRIALLIINKQGGVNDIKFIFDK